MDLQLVERAQRGDQGAYAELAEASVGRLLRVAQGILGDVQLAEDATQQALVSIWRELPRLREPARYEAWSYRLLVNACRSELRRRRRWLPLPLLAAPHEPTAADETRQVADRDQLERAFAGLSADHRAALILHHYVGHTVAATAELLGVPQGTVRSRLHYGMRALREAISPAGPSPGVEPVRHEMNR